MPTTTSTSIAAAPTRPLVRVGGMPRVGGGVLGPVGELFRDQYGALLRWQRDYGGVFELQLGPTSFVIAGDVNSATEVLIEGSQRFVRGGTLYEPLVPMFGRNSMLTAEGEVWRKRRRAAQPHFRQRAIAAMADRVNRTLGDLLTELGPGDRDLYQFGGRVSMSVALAVIFGNGLSSSGFAELARAVDYAIGRIGMGWVAHRLPKWFPLPGARRFRRELAVIDTAIHGMIADRLASGVYGDDLLGVLLHMADAGDLAPEDVRNEAMALIAAGYETTGNALGWAFWELARHPEIQARVQVEADAIADDPTPSPKALTYTRQVFCEVLRVYSSAVWVPRNAAEDTTLAGYPVKAGTAVLCSPYLVHHDPHAWDDPERFDPERFAEGSNQPRNRQAFMPFGLGQHMCIGQHLAMLEGPLALARLLHHWRIEPIAGREPAMRISTTMSSKAGVWLRLSPRG